MESDDLISLSEIARLAGVNKSAVTNWRDRYPDFPKPQPTSERGIFFRRADVAAWLRERKPGSFQIEQWLWDAACQIRGPLDAPKFKDYILPLIFLKRISDVFDDEVTRVGEELGDRPTAARLVDRDHDLVRFYIPPQSRWTYITDPVAWRSAESPPRNLAEALTDAVRAVSRQNPRLQGVIDTVDFNATAAGQPIVDAERLAGLVKTLGQHRLGLRDVEADLLGQAYEYLLKKFAEGQGQSAGEFFTPPEVGRMMARVVEPKSGMSIYDPACGSAGLLIKSQARLVETHGVAANSHRTLPKDVAPLRVFGQEINASTFAMSVMNAFLHDMDAAIELGDTMRQPAFLARGSLERFDVVIANPMWNQDFSDDVYRADNWDRFVRGFPPASSADWGWVQHMFASLKPDGRMAVVLDTGAVSRGSGQGGGNREREIRRQFVDDDLVEAVILLPENLFYNTTAQGIVLVLNRKKRYPGQILLVNASSLFVKGRPKNQLGDEHIATVAELYWKWQRVVGQSTILTLKEVAEGDYNLAPTRYVSAPEAAAGLSLPEAIEEFKAAAADRAKAEVEMWATLSQSATE